MHLKQTCGNKHVKLTCGSTKNSIKNLCANTPRVLCLGVGGLGALPRRTSDSLRFSPCFLSILRKPFKRDPPCHR